ncbi:calcium/calmodulin-dependent protein kinase type IV-like [Chelonus insularis]|uniref:calcium/calmodulin-dependent protein kinase type IV-like n=1 Tax=Chelonus insularis TaxID=460826 RepID=UPI00158B3C07|nr:calcium/calmodulin-dependent protein kinase type IV-like [Chelonus insularis]
MEEAIKNENTWLEDISRGVIQNQYIIGDIIGRGSTSTIHYCLHKGRKKYACKIVPKTKLNKFETLTRIHAMLSLQHENIVAVREAYDDALRVYIIEDLALGGELLERLASCGGYSEKDAAKAIQDAAAALEYIHDRGIVHGNLRPEKLLYAQESKESRLLLADIGSATPSMNSYKILYCAPEVIATGKATSASDIWSLGIVLYIILCGFEPFRNVEDMFPEIYWNDKTEEAKNLTAWLMQERSTDRPTARKLLENSWVRGEKTALHSMKKTVQHLREFNARRKFKAATLAVQATHRAIALSSYHDPAVLSTI